jgi:predicted DNA-binding protein
LIAFDARLSYMGAKVVTRSVRLEHEIDDRVEQLAAERGVTVSAFIRSVLADVTERAERRRRLEHALTVAADLSPQPDADRERMWGIGDRVPG